MRVRFLLGAAFFALGAPARADTPVVRDAQIPTPPEAMLNAAKEAEYFAHVAIGDRERAAGHVPEAAIAYARALHIRKDPVVGGRLGVLLVQAGKYGQAADLLSIALKHARTPTAERETYFRAYELTRKYGAWVDIIVSDAGAVVALDGEDRNPGRYSAFSIFVLTGDHRLTAVLQGFHNATVPFTVRADEDMRVEIELRPLVKRLERTTPPGPPRNEPAQQVTTNVATDPNYNRKEDPFYEEPKPDKPQEKTWPRFSVNAGVVTVFGVASWMPAVGPVVGVGLRPKEWLSFGLEGRAAWLTTPLADEPISVMTGGALLSACGHAKWFFGCALGHVGVLRTDGAESTFKEAPFVRFRPGVGGRVGARFRLSQGITLQAAVDALGLTNGTRVFIGEQLVAEQGPVMIGTQILGGWEY